MILHGSSIGHCLVYRMAEASLRQLILQNRWFEEFEFDMFREKFIKNCRTLALNKVCIGPEGNRDYFTPIYKVIRCSQIELLRISFPVELNKSEEMQIFVDKLL
jgi:hypothetical protein